MASVEQLPHYSLSKERKWWLLEEITNHSSLDFSLPSSSWYTKKTPKQETKRQCLRAGAKDEDILEVLNAWKKLYNNY